MKRFDCEDRLETKSTHLDPMTKKPTLSFNLLATAPKISHQKFSQIPQSQCHSIGVRKQDCKIWADLPNQRSPTTTEITKSNRQPILPSPLLPRSCLCLQLIEYLFCSVNCWFCCAMLSTMMRGTVLRPCARLVSRRMLCTVEKRAFTQLVSISSSRPATFFPRYFQSSDTSIFPNCLPNSLFML